MICKTFIKSFMARRAMALLAGIVLGSFATQALAQPVIRMVVPFAAGSYTDSVARIILPGIADRLGSTIVIDNKAGANGILGADYVAKAAPDGMTFLVGGSSVNSINPGVYKSLPYDPVRDLLPVVRFGLLPFVLVVHPSVPVNTVPELIAYAKKNPGTLAYATPNSSTLVGMETFKRVAGINILGVPYKSSPQAMIDLVGNHVQVLIADFATAMPHVRTGKARLLGVTMNQRSPLVPGAPPMSDSVKDFDLTAWTGLLAPAGTPSAAMSRVSDAVMAVLGSKETQDRLTAIGYDVKPMGADAFTAYVRSDIKTWGRLIREAGIQPE